MKKCPFKEGDHIYHIKKGIHYIVIKIYEQYTVRSGPGVKTRRNSAQTVLSGQEVYIVDERSSKGITLPLILIKEKNWKKYLTLKKYRKLKLQKLNEIRL